MVVHYFNASTRVSFFHTSKSITVDLFEEELPHVDIVFVCLFWFFLSLYLKIQWRFIGQMWRLYTYLVNEFTLSLIKYFTALPYYTQQITNQLQCKVFTKLLEQISVNLVITTCRNYFLTFLDVKLPLNWCCYLKLTKHFYLVSF